VPTKRRPDAWSRTHHRPHHIQDERSPVSSRSVRNGTSSVRREVNILSGEPRAVISSIWGPVESKSRSARSGLRSRASINILTYTTWNSRLIYCRYLGALVFGPPGADIICLKKCARQRGPPTTVLPILRGSDAALLTVALSFPSLSFFFLFSSVSRRHRRFRRSPRLTSSSLPLPRFTRRSPFGPGEIVLRSASTLAAPVGSNR